MKKISTIAATLLLACLLLGVGAVHANIGGPDAAGYGWMDSKSPAPSIPYNWIDISTTGTNTGIQCDDCYVNVPLGFTFSYYGNSYSTVNVSSNGYLSFTDGASAYSNQSIPYSNSPNNILAPLWDDLYVSYPAKVFYQTLGTAPNRVLVVHWSNVQFYYNRGAALNFQILLYEQSNTITFQYASMSGSGATGNSATIGIENATGMTGLQYSYNSSVISGNLAITFSRSLELVSNFPAVSASDAVLNANVRAGFNQPLDPASVSSSAMTVTGSQSGPVSGTVSYIPALSSIQFDPAADFAPGETVTVTVNPVFRSQNGSGLSSAYTWTFTAGTVADTEAPPQVAGLQAADVPHDAGGKIQLSWLPVTTSDFLLYRIYREASPITSVSGLTPVSLHHLNTYTDTTADGIPYYYAVTAIDASGNENSAVAVFGPVSSVNDPPRQPTGFNGSTNANGISLYWSANSDVDLAGYRVYAGTSSGVYGDPVDVGLTTAYQLTELENCTDYHVTVAAYDSAGNESLKSAERVISSGSPGYPSIPAGFAASVVDGAVVLSWTRSPECDVAGYYVYRSSAVGTGYQHYATVYGGDAVTYSDTAVANGATYYYKVTAYDNYSLTSGFTEEVSAVAVDTIPPATPYSLDGNTSSDLIYLSWYGNNYNTRDLAGFKVYFSTTEGEASDFALYPATFGGWNGFTLGGLADCTDYHIKVSAYDLSGNESPRSGVIVRKSGQAGVPAVPSGFIARSEESKITLSWDANPECDIYGYYIYRSTDGVSFSYHDFISATTYVDARIVHGTTYYYRLVARDTSSQTGNYTEPVSAVAIDTTAPAPPSWVMVQSQAGYNGLYVNWGGNTEPDIAGFKVYYGTSSGVYSESVSTGNTSWRTISDLQGCTLYYVVVAAVDLSGHESVYSVERSATASGSSYLQPPSSVTISSAESVVSLSWVANPECDVQGYRVYRKSGAGAYQDIGFVYGLTLEDRRLVNGVTYTYAIKAVSYGGVLSDYSAAVTAVAVDTTPPPAPYWVYASPGENLLDISWWDSQPVDFKEFRVYFGAAAGVYSTTFTTTGWSVQVPNLSACTTYFYKVKAVDLSGLESTSQEYSAQTRLPGAPGAPTNVTGQPGNNASTLSWSANPECDVREYRIFRSATSGGTFDHVGTVPGLSFTDGGLASETTYYYQVRAVDHSDLVGVPSAEIVVTTRDTIPPVQPVVDPTLTLVTRLSTFVLRGTKEANSSIVINGREAVAVTAATTWEAEVTLTQLTNILAITSRDAAGNTCAAVPVQVIRDTQAPQLASSHPSANGFVKTIPTAVTVRFVDAHSQVDLQASLQGAVIKNPSGNLVAGSWSAAADAIVFTPASALPDGLLTVTVYPVDTLGNKGSATFGFTIDRASPAVQSFTLSPVSPVKSGAATFTLTFSEQMDTAVHPTVTFTKGFFLPTYAATGSWLNATTWRGTYSFSSATGDGTYMVRVAGAQDRALNMMADQDTGTFVLDTTPPATPVVAAVTTPTKTSSQSVSGTKERDTAIIINGVQRVPLSVATSWSYTYPLVEGENLINVVARDEAGNDSPPVSPVPKIALDTTPPLFTVDSYQHPSTTAAQTISGRKEPGCTVKLNGVAIFPSTDLGSVWSHDLTLTEGTTNHLAFTAVDAMGNITTRSIDILYDISAPAPLGTGMVSADGNGRGNEVLLAWPSYPEPADLAYYRIYQGTSDFGSIAGMSPVATVSRGTRQHRAGGLVGGTPYYFAVVPVDQTGNSDQVIRTVQSVPVDSLAPEDITAMTAQAGFSAADGNTVTLNWSPSADSAGDLADQVLYVDDGRGYGAGTSLGKTATSYVSKGLSDATNYKFKVTTKDAGGRESTGALVQAVTRLQNPSGLSATPGSGKVVLSWTSLNSPYVKSYNIYRSQGEAQQTDTSAMTLIRSQTGTSFTDTGLTNGVAYQYAVTVMNTSGAERSSVQTVTATPRGDTTGPVIGASTVTAGQVITTPITISATAQDSESAMGRMQIYIDGILIKGQDGASVSHLWSVEETTDGPHTIRIVASDSLNNLTELSLPVVVSLAPPAVPVITTTFSGPITRTTVDLTGAAAVNSKVVLRVNNVVGQPASVAADGTFSFSGVSLVEGDNLLAVKGVNRAGESAFSRDFRITVDTGAPAAPTGLAARPFAGGSIQLSWQQGSGELPTGFNLYESTTAFTMRTDAGVRKVNSAPLTFMLNDLIPSDDTVRYYGVTAVDGAGNESPLSNIVSIAADRTGPAISDVRFTLASNEQAADGIYGPGTVKISFTVSEALKEQPFFSLEPASGSPLVVTARAVDATHYEAAVTLDAASPHGRITCKFSGKDMVGNRGSASVPGPLFDVRGPVATLAAPVRGIRTSAGAIPVAITLDEPSVTVPAIELRPAAGNAITVTGVATTDNGLSWSGTLDPTGLADGIGRFHILGAKDRFGNTVTDAAIGSSLVLYAVSAPAPDAPSGFTAKGQPGGLVKLSWVKSVEVAEYRLYRKRAGEAAMQIATVTDPNITTFTDTPETDGSYAYYITAVGLLGSESTAGTEVSAVSDRVAPPAPVSLALSLSGNGVRAVWAAAAGEVPASYRLYRSDRTIADVTGISSVASSLQTTATDTAATSVKRFYAVTAVDAVGNESVPSATEEIVFPVAPVRNMVLTRIDNGKPSLSWEPGEADLQGYHLYRNGSRITQVPTLSTTYSDGYYSSGAVTYGVSAVNALGTESPIKEATLPLLSVGLKEGTALHRGVLETAQVVLSLPQESASGISVDSVSLKIGSLPESSLPGPFDVTAGHTTEIAKVAATDSAAPPQVAVVVTAIMNPSPGTTVKITTSSAASVLSSGTALEIFNEPLKHGTKGRVRLKVNNLGTATSEFVTSENNGPTSHVTVLLKDQDGNILSQGRLYQQTGAVVNVGAYSLARVEPGTSFLSDPVEFDVPASAPANVVIEARIDTVWYHYNQDDQVTAPGLRQTVAAGIVDVAYRAIAATDKALYRQGEPVVITGQALASDNGQPVPSVPVKIALSVKGFDRFFTVNTDLSGNFSYTFTPAANETGTFSLWAAHPELADRTVQGQFSILGMSVSPDYVNIRVVKNKPQDIPVTLKNLSAAELTGLTFNVTASGGVAGTIINSGDDRLVSSETQAVTLRLTPQADAPDTASATVGITTAQGLEEKLTVNMLLLDAIPVIATSPSYIDTGMVRGIQKVVTFNVRNSGIETLRNARIEGPSIPWITLANDRIIGDIPAGQAAGVGMMLKPGESVQQGVYDDRLVIYSDNHIPYTFNIQVTVSSNTVGNVQFNVLNELMKDVAGATVTIQNQSLLELSYTLKTGTDGSVTFFDIPEGRYSYYITASGTSPTSGSFIIEPGLTVTVPVALEMKLVTVEWSVTPVVIEDRYEIKLTQTFETNVPTPVLVTEPANLTLPDLQPGQVFNGEYTVTNYGLIAVDNVAIEFPKSIGDYDIEVLTSAIPKRLNAMQKIRVPYRITRRAMVAGVFPTDPIDALYGEVRGFGGGTCYGYLAITLSGTAVICPNTPQQKTVTKYTTYYVSYPVPCGSGGSGSGGGGWWGGGGWSQSGGGGWGGGIVTTLPSTNPCDCKPDGTACPDDGNICTKDVCMSGSCTHPPDDGAVPPQADPNDCKKQICKNGSVTTANNDSEICGNALNPAVVCAGDYCKNGTCVHPPPSNPCDDGNPCTDDKCDATGCKNTPKGNGGSCDDNTYCTSYSGTDPGGDQCYNGSCLGKPIGDRNVGVIQKSINFAALDPIKAVVGAIIPIGDPDFVVELKGEKINQCCEPKQSIVSKNKATLTGQVSWPFGPIPIPGLSVPVGGIATFGLFVKGSLNAGVSGFVVDDKCKDQYCWGGSGQVGLQASLSGGGVIKKGDTSILEATINGNTGVQGSLVIDCTNARLEGQWDGVTVSLVWDVFDGFSHFETGLVLVQPKPVGPYNITMPSPN